jgi:transcriptional regulator with XRE-family HTH domain
MAIEKGLLGKAIRQVRELRGISQAALAKQAGLQGNSVALIERGQRGVSLDSLNAIADVLEVPAACLAMLGTSKIAGDSSSAALVKSLQKLTLAAVAAQAKLEGNEKAAARKTLRKGNWTARKEKPAKRKTAKKLELA